MADNKSCEGKWEIPKESYGSGYGGRTSTSTIGKTVVPIEVSETIKGLKAIQREAKKATAALRELETLQRSKDNLLSIELKDIDSVPVVHYKGEEITGVIHAGINWDTQTDVYVPSPKVHIEYADGITSQPYIKTIRHDPLGGDQS